MNNKIAIVLFARFPTEMAYGNHLIQIAKSFAKNDFIVNVYYPKTYNSKTIFENPRKYYQVDNNIQFKEIKNIDVTSYKLYQTLPDLLQKIIYSASTFFWSLKIKNYLDDEDYVWSTNPNILLTINKLFKVGIYEKHGEAKYIQKYSISKLKKKSNLHLIALTKKSLEELNGSLNEPIYLPNGFDNSLFYPSQKNNDILTIGFVGLLETYGVDKGVLNSVEEIVKINKNQKTLTIIHGGPDKKLKEINDLINKSEQEEYFRINGLVPHNKVSEIIRSLDIGIVPYPNNRHMGLYASPLKIFELAACGVPVLASNVHSHLELKEFNLGIHYFQHDDFDDFRMKLLDLINDSGLRESLRKQSIENIQSLNWLSRTKKIIESVRSSIG